MFCNSRTFPGQVVIAKLADIFRCQTRNAKVQALGRLLQEAAGKNDDVFQALA